MALITRETLCAAIKEAQRAAKLIAKETAQTMRKKFNVYQKLILAGAEMSSVNTYDLRYGKFHMRRTSDMRLVRKLVGKLELVDKDIEDADSETIRVTLRAKGGKYEGVRFSYTTKLGANSKCKIVTTSYTNTSTALVCPTDNG
jgi:hypothetical protein